MVEEKGKKANRNLENKVVAVTISYIKSMENDLIIHLPKHFRELINNNQIF